MATLEELVKEQIILKVDPVEIFEANQQPNRRIFVTPLLNDWIGKTLPSIVTDGYVEGAMKPNEQLFVAFQDFIAGARPEEFEMLPNRLRPRQHGVWELRTADLRIFGAFLAKDTFLACSASTKRQATMKSNAGYAHHRDQVIAFLRKNAFPEPKLVIGDLQDVLTFQAF